MKTNEIKKLIESFYDGTTSQREELLLLNYFSNEDVAEELLDEKEMFLQLYEPEEVDVPKSLALKLDSLIDDLAENETKKKAPTRHLLLWSSIAASIAILLAVGMYVNNLSITGNDSLLANEQQTTNTVSVTDAEYLEAENAMRLLSANFNKGMQQLDEMHLNLEKTNKILNETFKNN